MDNIGKLSTEPHPSINLNLPRCIFLLPSRSWPDVGVASVASAAGSTSCKSSPRKLKTWLLGTSTISATSSGAMPRSNMPRCPGRTNAGNTHGNLHLLPIGSMYAIYGNIYHQYTPNNSIYIYIPAPWILWVMGFPCATTDKHHATLGPPKALESKARSMSRALPSSMTCRSGKRWTFLMPWTAHGQARQNAKQRSWLQLIPSLFNLISTDFYISLYIDHDVSLHISLHLLLHM